MRFNQFAAAAPPPGGAITPTADPYGQPQPPFIAPPPPFFPPQQQAPMPAPPPMPPQGNMMPAPMPPPPIPQPRPPQEWDPVEDLFITGIPSEKLLDEAEMMALSQAKTEEERRIIRKRADEVRAHFNELRSGKREEAL